MALIADPYQYAQAPNRAPGMRLGGAVLATISE